MATAAAAQRMRGPPQPVGLGTDRQHMFLASFLLPLPSFFLWLPPSLSQTPPTITLSLFFFHTWCSFPSFGLFMRLAAWIEQRSRLPVIPGFPRDGAAYFIWCEICSFRQLIHYIFCFVFEHLLIVFQSLLTSSFPLNPQYAILLFHSAFN